MYEQEILADPGDKALDENVYGLYSGLDPSLCQYCGSVDGMIVVWDDPEDLDNNAHTLRPCPVCNGGEK